MHSIFVNTRVFCATPNYGFAIEIHFDILFFHLY